MKKLLLLLLLIPLLSRSQTIPTDSAAISGSIPTTPSNWRKFGSNVSNYRLQFLAAPNKMVELLNTYQFNNAIGVATLAKITAKVDTGEIYVFLIVGQSNASGQGDETLSPQVKPGTAYQYYKGVIKSANDKVGTAGTGSMWPAFAIRYNELTGRKIAFVPASKGSTSMTTQASGAAGNWTASDTLRSYALQQYNLAVAAFTAAGYKPKLGGILISQGEQDGAGIAAGTTTKAQYKSAFENLNSYWRANIDPYIPIYIFRTGKRATSPDTYTDIRNSQEEIAAADPLTRVVLRDTYDYLTMGYMKADNLHYNQYGLNYSGYTGAGNLFTQKETPISTSYIKTGFNVKRPLGVVDIAAGTDSIPALIINKGAVGTAVRPGAIRNDGYNLHYTDSTTTDHLLIKSATTALPISGTIPYFNSNGDMAADTAFSRRSSSATTAQFYFGEFAPYSGTHRVVIKGRGVGSGSDALAIYDNNNVQWAQFRDNKFFYLSNSATLNINNASGGVGTVLIQSGTTGISPLALKASDGSDVGVFSDAGTFRLHKYTSPGILTNSNTGVVASSLGSANQILRVNSGATGTEWFTPTYGSGTVTSFSKTDNFGIVSTVTNPTSTPNHAIGVDTTLIRSSINSFTKAQSDLRFGGLNANNIWFGTNDYRAQSYFKFGAYFYDLNSGFRTQIAMSNKLTADRIIDFPDKPGTLLVTSDLTGYAQIAGINAFTNRNTFMTNDAVNSTATFTNSAVNGVALNIAGGQSLFNGPVAFNSSALSIGQFAHSSSSTILLAQGAQFRFNNAAATFYQNFTWANATANRSINWRDKGGDVAFVDDIPTQLRLTGSGTGAATTISIAHGLTGVTSASIALIQPINAASAGISYITTDATNINIVYAVAPLLGTNNLSYNVSIKP